MVLLKGGGAAAIGFIVFFIDRVSKIRALQDGSASIDQTVLFFFQNSLLLTALLALFSIMIIVLLARLPMIHSSFSGFTALALVVGGGVGNLIDRFAFSGVINPFSFMGLNANIADAALLIGGGLLIALCFPKSTRAH